jgi:hypothetical protein
MLSSNTFKEFVMRTNFCFSVTQFSFSLISMSKVTTLIQPELHSLSSITFTIRMTLSMLSSRTATVPRMEMERQATFQKKTQR